MQSIDGWGVAWPPFYCQSRYMASTFARNLRATPTDAEMRLWSRLRRSQLDGFRFRRQHPIGNYIVDFFCPVAKLIVEVDGGQHPDDGDWRTHWLEARGYRVVRLWNNEVLGNTDGVLLAITEALRAAPPTRQRSRVADLPLATGGRYCVTQQPPLASGGGV